MESRFKRNLDVGTGFAPLQNAGLCQEDESPELNHSLRGWGGVGAYFGAPVAHAAQLSFAMH